MTSAVLRELSVCLGCCWQDKSGGMSWTIQPPNTPLSAHATPEHLTPVETLHSK